MQTVLKGKLSGLVLLLAAFSMLPACGEKDDMDARRGFLVERGSPTHEAPSGSSDRIERPFDIPGFPDFRLQPFLDRGDVMRSYSTLRTDMTEDPWDRCSERAHVWSYQMHKDRGATSGKVFIFYTNKGIGKTPNRKRWLWHVAPYVATQDGKLWVMENFAGVRNPVGMKEWLRYQSSYQREGQDCVELDGSEREVYKYICGRITAMGECTDKLPDVIQVGRDGPKCYFRRMPQYYVYPRDVANHDYLGKPAVMGWDEQLVYNVCRIPMSGMNSEEINEKCASVINAAALRSQGFRVDDFLNSDVEIPSYSHSGSELEF